MGNFLIGVVRREASKMAISHIVAPIGHHAAKEADPFALHIKILHENTLTRRCVRSDCLEFAHSIGIAGLPRGVHGEAPATTLGFRPVGYLPNADVGGQPLGMMHRKLEAEVAAPAMAQDKDFILAEFLT